MSTYDRNGTARAARVELEQAARCLSRARQFAELVGDDFLVTVLTADIALIESRVEILWGESNGN